MKEENTLQSYIFILKNRKEKTIFCCMLIKKMIFLYDLLEKKQENVSKVMEA